MYAETADILGYMQQLRPKFTESNIHDEWIGLAATNIYKTLLKDGVSIPATDINDLLKYAEICFYMEIACMNAEIESRVGDVLKEQMGRWSRQYAKSMPMFFFATGGSDPFMKLLPHETWRMMAYSLVDAYVMAYFEVTYGQLHVANSVSQASGFDWSGVSTGQRTV